MKSEFAYIHQGQVANDVIRAVFLSFDFHNQSIKNLGFSLQ